MARRKNVPYFLNLQGGFSGMNNPGGITVWVAPSGYAAYDGSAPSDSHDGLSPQEPKATIQAGLNACTSGRGDIVALLPGSYTVTAALTMTKDDVTLASAVPVLPRERSPVKIVNETDVNTVEVNANDVTIYGIEFDDNVATSTADKAAVAVNTSNTATDYTNFKLVNCFIDMLGSDDDRDGVALGLAGDATDGAIGSLVQGCTILDCDQDAIAIAAGSELSVVRDCAIIEKDNGTRYGIDVAAVSCAIEGCEILVSGTACICGNVAAARLTVSDCLLHAWGANTIGLQVAATGTCRSARNYITATAAGNLVDYTTDNTTPSANADVTAIFAATPGATVFVTPTVDGS